MIFENNLEAYEHYLATHENDAATTVLVGYVKTLIKEVRRLKAEITQLAAATETAGYKIGDAARQVLSRNLE